MKQLSTDTLKKMLAYRRPHLGTAVHLFVERFILCDNGADSLIQDEMGNVVAVVGYKGEFTLDTIEDDMPQTLFCSHVDTVHRSDGFQTVLHSATNILGVPENEHCLGADDGAGVWLMLNMMRKGVKGVYIFHQGEERGGLGSRHMAKTHPEFLAQFDRAIAFDRAGTNDVITYQSTGMCCSDEFATQLSGLLSKGGMDYLPCDGGVYTDTAEYTHLIPECTNIAVGYFNEHSDNETLDLTHLETLRNTLLNLEWDSLLVARDAGDDGFELESAYVKLRDHFDEFGDIYDTCSVDEVDDRESFNRQPLTESQAWELVVNEPTTAVDMLIACYGS